ncbi:MAG TPA: hypothetical protein VFO76_04075, partial [Candidatus Kapabacteria bacterium]|nr:hypothetical protein [Candidatus Kapabacteria bacterium]
MHPMKLLGKALSIATLIVLMSVSMVSKSAAQYENAITINPLPLIFPLHELSAQYEFSTSRSNSLAIRGNFVSSIADFNAVGFGGTYRFFLTDEKAIGGFAVGPALDLFFFSNSTTNRSVTVYAFGADASYQFFFSHFALQPQLDLRFGGGGDGVTAYIGTNIYLSLYLGYAW